MRKWNVTLATGSVAGLCICLCTLLAFGQGTSVWPITTATLNESGSVDVDDPAANGNDFHLIAGYAGLSWSGSITVHVEPEQTTAQVAEAIQIAWNSLYAPEHKIGRSGARLYWPGNPELTIEEDGVAYDLDEDVTITLECGLRLHRNWQIEEY